MREATRKRCDCCGGELGPHPLGLTYRERTSTFCSFGCAVIQAAPACFGCGAKVLARGYSVAGRTYCQASCADVELAARE